MLGDGVVPAVSYTARATLEARTRARGAQYEGDGRIGDFEEEPDPLGG